MRFLFSTITGTGHFFPLIPYAKEFVRRGHEVRVAATDRMTEQITAAGLEHAVFDSPTDAERTAVFAQVAHLPPPERGPFINAYLFAGLLPRKALPACRPRSRAGSPI